MSMRMVGWPSEAETARSVTPGTVASTALISLPSFDSVSRSLPEILTEFSPFTPEAASWTLSWMYCEKVNSTPGNAFSRALLISAIRASLSRPLRHWSTGFSGTKNSALKKPVESVPSSGRPCCEMTVSASGKLLMSLRMRLA